MDNEKIWDITPLVTDKFPLWPGSTPLQREIVCSIEKGAPVTTSDILATAHLGAHADAPSHYFKDGQSIEERSLKYYLGPCQVIRPKVSPNEAISKGNTSLKILAPRLLFATATFDYSKPFQKDFASFDPSFFESLAKQGVITVGIDGPSVDLYDEEYFPCHEIAYQYDMALLENLDLSNVPEGLYELIALPLKIKGFDASPVRAILRSS